MAYIIIGIVVLATAITLSLVAILGKDSKPIHIRATTATEESLGITSNKPSLKDRVAMWRKDKTFKNVSLVTIFIVAILFGGWLSSESRPNSIRTGDMLFDGRTITVEKHKGDDYSNLILYNTPGEGFPLTLNTCGKKVMILEWKQKGEEWFPSTRGPVVYGGGAISNCSIETFSVFLDSESKIDKLTKVTAKVDKSTRCSSQGEFAPA